MITSMTKAANGTGTTFQVSDGTWRAQLTLADGRKKTRTRATENQAKKALKDLVAERDALVASGVVAPASLTVNDVIDSWLALGLPSRRGRQGTKLAPQTIAAYRHCAANLKREIGHLRTASVRVRDLDDAFNRLAAGGDKARQTLVKTRSVLSMVFAFAVKREEMARNLATSITMPLEARESKEGKSLTIEQARAVKTAAIGHRWHALVVVSLDTGLRPGELTGLCWDCIDLDAGTMSVERAMRINAKGKRELSDVLKTKASRRAFLLTDEAVVALRAHQDRQRLDDLATGVRSDLVFRTSLGTAIEPRNLARDIQKFITAAGIEGHWTPNEMRHTFASIIIDQGVDAFVAKDLMGHSMKMLETQYRKNLRPIIDGGVEALNRVNG
jgi:integrase